MDFKIIVNKIFLTEHPKIVKIFNALDNCIFQASFGGNNTHTQTRRKRPKSALYLTLKQRKLFKISSGLSNEKLTKKYRDTFQNPNNPNNWDHLGFSNILPVAKYQKNLKVDPLETFKNFRKRKTTNLNSVTA